MTNKPAATGSGAACPYHGHLGIVDVNCGWCPRPTPPASQPTVTANLDQWQKRLECSFYKLGVEHFRGCQINQTDFCTCGALDDRKAFRDAMTEFFALLRAAEQK